MNVSKSFAMIFAASIVTLSSLATPHNRNFVDAAPITGGTFTMGTDSEDIAELKARYQADFPGVFKNETPAHQVTVRDFHIDRFEVTNARYLEFLERVPTWRKDRIDDSEHNGRYLSHWRNGRYPAGSDNRPVVFVTWSAAQAYCRWRGGRLPTEAEWEFVASSGGDREFPWGDEAPDPERANYFASGHGEPVDVGSYPPNEAGVYDLAGNVWEFLLDAWAPDYGVTANIDRAAGGPDTHQRQPRADSRRAVRGASFGGSVVNLRTRWRDSHVVSNATAFVGFRCAYPREPD